MLKCTMKASFSGIRSPGDFEQLFKIKFPDEPNLAYFASYISNQNNQL